MSFGIPVRNGLGLGLLASTSLATRNTSVFSPASLFAAGEQGVWYDPSDLTTLFQDSAGTTPVTAVEQAVGRMLDKSGRGNHATQSTSAARPVLSARVNLLLATTTLATQSVTTVATGYTLRFTGSGSITLSGTATGTYTAGSYTFTPTAGTLTLTVSGSVTDADLRATNDGVGLPVYQRVNTTTDYDTTGFPLYLAFDGTDDSMATGSINFTSTAQMSVFSGLRKLTDAGYNVIVASGVPTVDTNRFGIFSTYNGTGAYGYQLSGTNSAFVGVSRTTSAFSAPRTDVLTSQISIAVTPITSAITTNVNSVNAAMSELFVYGAPGSAFANSALSIGQRPDNSFRLNGRIYSLIVRGAASTAQQISDTETWVNGKTFAYA